MNEPGTHPIEYFWIAIIEVAAFVMACGIPLVTVTQINEKFVKFGFPIEERIKIIGATIRYDNRGTVEAKLFAEKLKELKILVAQHKRSHAGVPK